MRCQSKINITINDSVQKSNKEKSLKGEKKIGVQLSLNL